MKQNNRLNFQIFENITLQRNNNFHGSVTVKMPMWLFKWFWCTILLTCNASKMNLN